MKLHEILQTTDLTEINMSPSSVQAKAAQVPGALVGIEFEMYVPDVMDPTADHENNGDEDMILNMNEDRPIESQSWDDLVRDVSTFYANGDNAIHSRSYYREELNQQPNEDYISWLDDKFYDWAKDGRFEEWYLERNPDEEELPRAASNAWHRAFDEFKEENLDDFSFDDGSVENWLRDKRIDTYSSFGIRYGLEWTYTRPNRRGGGSMSIEEVAEDFGHAVGFNVLVSKVYHGRAKSLTDYVVEPDSSLEQPRSDEDFGLEFVSPPLPINEMITQLHKVRSWAESYGAYTNQTCGLHMNVSIPGYDLKKLDYIKLALFVGDDHVATSFDRLGNKFAKSSIDEITKKIKAVPDNIPRYADIFKKGLSTIASRSIHNGWTEKYMSINTQENRIEFRSPGGDWLNTDIDKLINVMFRFVVALDIALDPEKEKKEYAKKFYKLLAGAKPTENIDTLKYFALYFTKNMPLAALKSYLRQAQFERGVKGLTTGSNIPFDNEKTYRITYENGETGDVDEVLMTAKSRRELVDKFQRLFGQYIIRKVDDA